MEYAIIRANSNEEYLAHHGVKGQHWGVRRYQNEDGSLTAEGREKYGQQGWEARQMYKKGTISKEQYKEAKKAGNIIGKVDNVLNLGFGRRMREFEQRHKKGIMATTAALGVAGTIAAGILTGGAAPAIVGVGSKACGALLGTGIRLGVTNKLLLKYGYNSKITNEGFKSTRPDYQNKG